MTRKNTRLHISLPVKLFILEVYKFDNIITTGSARSFVCPKVHWTLKAHLIDALGGGWCYHSFNIYFLDPHVFVRISSEDNANTKTGKGVKWNPNYNNNEINETLKILNPKVVQYFSFDNQIEEMKTNYPGWNHTVFRENDQRRFFHISHISNNKNKRYSMFFHRCMAYKLALRYEQQHGIRFDWVVLVRLDAAWLEPVLPIEVGKVLLLLKLLLL